MDLLYYNELEIKQVEKNYQKTIDFLKKNDFKSAETKKMQNTGFYRAKLDDKNRLLFKFAKFEDKTYILILEVILNHEYSKSKFLRGCEIDETKIISINQQTDIIQEDIKELSFLNKKHKHFYILDKILSFDSFQEEVYGSQVPVIIIGSAGSGKTVLTLEKLKKLNGNIAYISLSKFLVENAEKIYSANNYNNPSQEVEFLSFQEYLETIKRISKKEITYQIFERWFNKHFTNFKIKEPFKIYEEFKGVITGSIIDKPYLSQAEYIDLGVKQSIILKQDREKIYEVFEKYLNFLNENNYFDINILSFEYLNLVNQKYDYVLIDEVQDITNIQLKLILNSLKHNSNFILSGDSNQIVHPNFFSWSKIKSMFYLTDLKGTLTRILTTNYRNSAGITNLSNTLLKIKNARFGSIDKESNYLINSVSTTKGEIKLFDNDNKIKNELNQKTQNSTKFAVLVLNNEHKIKVKENFKTPLIFSIQEAKGLEYENIILVNFVSNYENEFYEITKGVEPEILDDDLKYSRAKNKEDKDLEVYKFFINSLYVAFTRAMKNIYIIETNSKHKLLQLLQLKTPEKKLNIESQKSTDNDWLNEADRLEKQGKFEQSQQIRDRLKGLEYISNEEYNELRIKALDKTKKEQDVKRERKDLFKYAVARNKIEDVKRLAELNFQRAIFFMQEYNQTKKIFTKNLRTENFQLLESIINQHGIDFRTTENEMTGLTYSCSFGFEKMIDYFIKKNASPKLTDVNGLIPLQHLIKQYYKPFIINQNYKKKDSTALNILLKYYTPLQIPSFKCFVDEKIIKINCRSMEYNLINLIFIISEGKSKKNPLTFSVSDFVGFAENMPDEIISERRKKRPYINSILANNEVDRDFIYNKKLFKRVRLGVYILNPDLKIIFDEESSN